MSFDVAVEKRRGEALVSARIAPGDGLTILFGPSGAGKTSVLHMIAGLVRPDAGHIRVGGVTLFDDAPVNAVDLPPERRRAGYVFQEPRLFPHLRVRDNLRYGNHDSRGGQVGGGAMPPLDMDADAVIDLLGIAPLLGRWPRTLSGGEARRVAIGRALLSGPAFLLLDEPLSSLDRARREEIMLLLERLRDTLRLPILMVTHDREEAERLGTHIVAV